MDTNAKMMDRVCGPGSVGLGADRATDAIGVREDVNGDLLLRDETDRHTLLFSDLSTD